MSFWRFEGPVPFLGSVPALCFVLWIVESPLLSDLTQPTINFPKYGIIEHNENGNTPIAPRRRFR